MRPTVVTFGVPVVCVLFVGLGMGRLPSPSSAQTSQASGRKPFVEIISVNSKLNGKDPSDKSLTVPSGRILHIDFVSARGEVPKGQSYLLFLEVKLPQSGSPKKVSFAVWLVPNDSSLSLNVNPLATVNQNLGIQLPSDTVVDLGLFRANMQGAAKAEASVFGYLE